MNDEATSWSLCNNTGRGLWFAIRLFTDASYGADEIRPQGTGNFYIPNGLCASGNHISPNDAVSSYKIYASTSKISSSGWGLY